MWIPQYIEIKNILSHVDTFHNFNMREPVLLLGINNDLSEPGKPKRSNGSGKSTFIDAISICLTGDSIRNVKLSELVRNGEPFGEVEMCLYNTLLSREMIVYWKIYSGGSPSEFRVTIDGQIQSQIPSVLEAKKFVLEQLGFTKEDLYNYFVVSKGSYKAFFSSSDNEKKDIINRFSQASLVDPVVVEGQSRVNGLDVKVKQLLIQLSTLNTTRTQLLEQLENAQVDDRKGKIVEIESRIKSCEDIITQALLQKNRAIDKIKEFEVKEKAIESTWLSKKSEIEELDAELQEAYEIQKSFNLKIHGVQLKYQPEYDAITKSEQQLRTYLTQARTGLSDYEHRKIELESFLKGLVTCPKCSNKFSLREDLTVEDATHKLKDVSLSLQSIQMKIDSIQKDIDKLPIQRAEIDAKVKKDVEHFNTSLSETSEIVSLLENTIKEARIDHNNLQRQLENVSQGKSLTQTELRVFESQITEKTSLIDSLKETIEQLNNSKDTTVADVLSKQLKEMAETITKVGGELEEQQSKLNLDREWLQHFIQFKSFLANKSISSITGYTNLYLQKMGTTLRVLIDGFKTLQDGSIREKINIQVTRDGVTPESFQKFSGGERAACEIAFILSLQKLFNLSCDNGGLNLLVLDEVIESLDSEGINEVFKPLETLRQCILLITHGNISSFRYNYIVFEKTNNETVLLE